MQTAIKSHVYDDLLCELLLCTRKTANNNQPIKFHDIELELKAMERVKTARKASEQPLPGMRHLPIKIPAPSTHIHIRRRITRAVNKLGGAYVLFFISFLGLSTFLFFYHIALWLLVGF